MKIKCYRALWNKKPISHINLKQLISTNYLLKLFKVRYSTGQDLEVWQKSMDLVVDCYRLTKTFPKSETYGLISQVRRSAVSVPANPVK